MSSIILLNQMLTLDSKLYVSLMINMDKIRAMRIKFPRSKVGTIILRNEFNNSIEPDVDIGEPGMLTLESQVYVSFMNNLNTIRAMRIRYPRSKVSTIILRNEFYNSIEPDVDIGEPGVCVIDDQSEHNQSNENKVPALQSWHDHSAE
ncbi:hypothetical protein J6590_093869 [Homalodisca vitripennis]|nr:hypothetical protein J6590_093869 [Homalodisca vitripennis]